MKRAKKSAVSAVSDAAADSNASGPPWPLQANCDSFYGDPRGAGGSYSPQWAAANLVHVPCPWVLMMDKQHVPFITIHRKCADSLKRVLGNIWDAVGKDQGAIESLHYNRYSGSFNFRPMRGGIALSMHSYGVAIDWDAEENPQHSTKHLFREDSLLVVKFKEEDWIWGGDWSGSSIDAMHVQAARVHV
jgi:D-alanyl-D-alanine carboxypeptidase